MPADLRKFLFCFTVLFRVVLSMPCFSLISCKSWYSSGNSSEKMSPSLMSPESRTRICPENSARKPTKNKNQIKIWIKQTFLDVFGFYSLLLDFYVFIIFFGSRVYLALHLYEHTGLHGINRNIVTIFETKIYRFSGKNNFVKFEKLLKTQ